MPERIEVRKWIDLTAGTDLTEGMHGCPNHETLLLAKGIHLTEEILFPEWIELGEEIHLPEAVDMTEVTNLFFDH